MPCSPRYVGCSDRRAEESYARVFLGEGGNAALKTLKLAEELAQSSQTRAGAAVLADIQWDLYMWHAFRMEFDESHKYCDAAIGSAECHLGDEAPRAQFMKKRKRKTPKLHTFCAAATLEKKRPQ